MTRNMHDDDRRFQILSSKGIHIAFDESGSSAPLDLGLVLMNLGLVLLRFSATRGIRLKTTASASP